MMMERMRPFPRSVHRDWDGVAIRQRYLASSASKPWAIGYRSIEVESVGTSAPWSGDLPADLRGTLYRNGAARHELADQRYGHRWDGDGMIQRFQLDASGVEHRGRYVLTEKFETESRAGHFLFSGFGTHVPGSDALPPRLDTANPANISVVQCAGELLALWEAGSAYRVDPESLNTLGRKVWSRETDGRPFSAHPRIATDGCMWNFGADPLRGELTVYEISIEGILKRSVTLHIRDLPPIHDFAITASYLVFLLPSLALDKEKLLDGCCFAASCRWAPEHGMRMLIVDRDDWSFRTLMLPAGNLFHVVNAWEEGTRDVVVIQYLRSPDPLSLLAGWSVMSGEYTHREGARLTEAVADLRASSVTQQDIGVRECEFPSIPPEDVGRRQRLLLCAERTPHRSREWPGFDSIALYSASSNQPERFLYGDGWLVEEHLLVGGPKLNTNWAIGTAIDTESRQTVVSVFDTARLSMGPIAQARLSYAIPLGLHGTFVHA